MRSIPIMHYSSPRGHCELLFRNVRVPVSNLIGEEGNGFRLAQERLSVLARVSLHAHHRPVCELALEPACEQFVGASDVWASYRRFRQCRLIAETRPEVDQARLLVLKAAWTKWIVRAMRRRASDVSAIKIVAARLQTRVIDRAMQVFGAMGLTPDTPLSHLWTWGALRFLDGPDEVHLRVAPERTGKSQSQQRQKRTLFCAAHRL